MQTIVGIRRLEETLQRSEGNGDNWHMTWAHNDSQYVVLGDGKGWPDAEGRTGQTSHTGVYGLDGDPPDLTFAHLHGYSDLVVGENPMKNRYHGVAFSPLTTVSIASSARAPFCREQTRFLARPGAELEEPGSVTPALGRLGGPKSR